MIRRMIERCCGKEKADRIVHWWCNPSRWMEAGVYLAVIVWFLGILFLNTSIQHWADSMEDDRLNLQGQIKSLEIQMDIHGSRGIHLPEGGP